MKVQKTIQVITENNSNDNNIPPSLSNTLNARKGL